MTKIKEIWKDIDGFPGYQVSDHGRVKSFIRRRGKVIILRPGHVTSDYRAVLLTKNKKGYYLLVHRLVAVAFIPNPTYRLVVNHKNSTPSDNRVENLEWVTHRRNIIHSGESKGRLVGAQKNSQKSGKLFKSMIHLNGKRLFLGTFATAKLASEAYFNKVKEIENGRKQK